MSQSLDLLKNITSFYFWYRIQVLLDIQMKNASHTSIITAQKFGKISAQPHTKLRIQFLDRENHDKNNTLPIGKQICFTIVWGCAEILPKFYFQYKMTTLYLRSLHPFPSSGTLRTVQNHLWTRIHMHPCNRIQLLLSLVQMFLLDETHLTLQAPLLQVQWKRQTEESRWLCWNVLLNACYGQALLILVLVDWDHHINRESFKSSPGKKDKQQLSHQFYLTVINPFTPKSAKSKLRRNL